MQSMKARDPLIYHEFLGLTNPTLYVNMMNQGLLSRLTLWLVLSLLPSQIMAPFKKLIKGFDIVQVADVSPSNIYSHQHVLLSLLIIFVYILRFVFDNWWFFLINGSQNGSPVSRCKGICWACLVVTICKLNRNVELFCPLIFFDCAFKPNYW